jgi:hypothetical protein
MPSSRLQSNLRPLCPDHYEPMSPADQARSDGRYCCSSAGCRFCWQWDSGYFIWEDGRIEYPPSAIQLVRPALIREHGYLYISSFENGERTWQCPAQGCVNTLREKV